MKEKSTISAIYNKGRNDGATAEKQKFQNFLSNVLVNDVFELEKKMMKTQSLTHTELAALEVSQIKSKLMNYMGSNINKVQARLKESARIGMCPVSPTGLRIEEKGDPSFLNISIVDRIELLKNFLRNIDFNSDHNLLLIKYSNVVTHLVFKLVQEDKGEMEKFKADVLQHIQQLRLINENYYEQGNMCYWQVIVS